MTKYSGAGVYVFRARRPGLIGRLYWEVVLTLTAVAAISLWIWGLPIWYAALGFLFWPTHFAYVGESNAVQLRRRAHLYGGGKFQATSKPWADLVTSWGCIPLPGAPKWVLRSVETLFILLFWPVYNHAKNGWNPRRIPLRSAKRQAEHRKLIGWSFNFRLAHLALVSGVASLVAIQGGWWS